MGITEYHLGLMNWQVERFSFDLDYVQTFESMKEKF